MSKAAINREQLAESLHTALRKLGDSPQTSLTWHLIYLADSSWSAYLDSLCEELESDSPASLKRITLALFDGIEPESVRGEHRLWTAFGCAFQLFSDVDWGAFAGYLEYVDGIAAEAGTPEGREE